MDVLSKTKQFEKVCEIMSKHNYEKSQLISILRATQEVYNYLPKPILAYIATSLKISPARVFGVATFYSFFTLTPKGEHVIKVCDGTACHVKNSTGIVDAIRKKLNLTEKNNTTDDLKFTLDTVSCLGACGLAPVVVIDETVLPQMNAETIIAELIKMEEEKEEVQDARVAC